MNRFPRMLMTLGLAAASLPVFAQHYRVDPDRRAPRAGRDGWVEIAELTARRGEPKEVTVGYEIIQIRIEAVAETVIINTIVTREGPRTTPHRVGGRFTAGQNHVVDLGEPKMVTGLRISDDNRGRYKVYVRPAPARRSQPAPAPSRGGYAQPRHVPTHAVAPRAAGGYGWRPSPPPPASACACSACRSPHAHAGSPPHGHRHHSAPPPPPTWNQIWRWDPWAGRWF